MYCFSKEPSIHRASLLDLTHVGAGLAVGLVEDKKSIHRMYNIAIIRVMARIR